MLGTTGKRILLTVHIVLNSVWMRGVAAILFLNGAKGAINNGAQLSALNEAIFSIHDVVVMNVG